MAIMVAVASLAPLLVPLLMNSLLSSYFCLLTPCAGDDRFSRTSSGGRRRIDQQPVPVAWPCVALIKLNPSGSLAWPQIDQCQYHEKVKYMGSFSAQTKMSKQHNRTQCTPATIRSICCGAWSICPWPSALCELRPATELVCTRDARVVSSGGS